MGRLKGGRGAAAGWVFDTETESDERVEELETGGGLRQLYEMWGAYSSRDFRRIGWGCFGDQRYVIEK